MESHWLLCPTLFMKCTTHYALHLFLLTPWTYKLHYHCTGKVFFPSILGYSLNINYTSEKIHHSVCHAMWGGPQVLCTTGPLPLNYAEVVIATPKLLDVKKKKAPPKKLWREQPQVRSLHVLQTCTMIHVPKNSILLICRFCTVELCKHLPIKSWNYRRYIHRRDTLTRYNYADIPWLIS